MYTDPGGRVRWTCCWSRGRANRARWARAQGFDRNQACTPHSWTLECSPHSSGTLLLDTNPVHGCESYAAFAFKNAFVLFLLNKISDSKPNHCHFLPSANIFRVSKHFITVRWKTRIATFYVSDFLQCTACPHSCLATAVVGIYFDQ